MKTNHRANRHRQAVLVVVLFLIALVPSALKLAKIIDWSWTWSTAPVWIPLAIAILVVIKGELVYIWRRYGP